MTMSSRYVRQRTELQRLSIWDYKSLFGCEVCGRVSDPAHLTFHHLGDKEFTIGNRIGAVSWDKLDRELAKCIVVCRECHDKIHNGKDESE